MDMQLPFRRQALARVPRGKSRLSPFFTFQRTPKERVFADHQLPDPVAAGLFHCLLVVLGFWTCPHVAAGQLHFSGDVAVGVIRTLANLDDDDRDGQPDAADEVINGDDDVADCARISIETDDPRITSVRVTAGSPEIRLFIAAADGWQVLGENESAPLRNNGCEMLVECRSFAAAPPAWNGQSSLTAVGLDSAGTPRGSSTIDVGVFPIELVPETGRVREVFVARGIYDNQAFLEGLGQTLGELDVPLTIHDAERWQEMWMQDTMEVAASGDPRRLSRSMTVVLAGLRDVDPFPPTLLGPDVAVVDIASPRGLEGGDAWVDWYGNLMVSPPTPKWPRGRVITGRNLSTGVGFHPDVIAFLAAQGVQPPVWIDTSWLLIKHVDEVVAFLPGTDGRGVLVVPDPLEGVSLARKANLQFAVTQSKNFVETNRIIAAAIDEMLEGNGARPRSGSHIAAENAVGLLGLLGWDPARVVRLPVAFVANDSDQQQHVTNAEAIWSNPLNVLLVNGTVVCGSAEMPKTVMDVCRERFLAAGAKHVVFLDDHCYHRAKGNVHCSTNTRRE